MSADKLNVKNVNELYRQYNELYNTHEGFISIAPDDGVHISEETGLDMAPLEEWNCTSRNEKEYPWEYRKEFDGVVYFFITKERLQETEK